jgi:hypothetical protein
MERGVGVKKKPYSISTTKPIFHYFNTTSTAEKRWKKQRFERFSVAGWLGRPALDGGFGFYLEFGARNLELTLWVAG